MQDQDELKRIIDELSNRNGGMILEQDNNAKAVVLSLDKYNFLVDVATGVKQAGAVNVKSLFPSVAAPGQTAAMQTPVMQAAVAPVQPSAANLNRIVVLGLGFVGQANAIALARMGYEVWAQDIKPVQNLYQTEDFSKLHMFTDGRTLPFSPADGVPVMVCVNAYNTGEGQDLSAVRTALAEARRMTQGLVILRTTVVPKHFKHLDFDLYFPEFLHERTALQEAQFPEMLVLGYNNAKARENLPKFILELKEYIKSNTARKFYEGSAEEASYIKYLHNIWNALRIGFVNEYGRAIIEDGFWGSHEKIIDFVMDRAYYLRFGKPFGGHCLKKDSDGFFTEHPSMKILQGLIESNLDHEKFTQSHEAQELYYGDK